MEEAVKILLVEDNDADAEYIKELLEDHIQRNEFELSRASSIKESSELLRNEKYDILLLDLGLPDSRGDSTISKIKSVAGGTPLFVLTGSVLKRDELRHCIIDSQEYIVKDFLDKDSLIHIIQSVNK